MLNFKQQQEQVSYEQRIIMGVTKFNEKIDGVLVDTTNVFIAMPFNYETGSAMGFGVSKVKFGTHQNYHRFVGVDFPCTADVAFKTVTNSSGKQQVVMVDFRLSQPQQKPVKE